MDTFTAVFYFFMGKTAYGLSWIEKGPHGGGYNKQTIDGLEDIETFFTEIVIKFVII